MLTLSRKNSPRPPQAWRAICAALRWDDHVTTATWTTLMSHESDPYLRGTGASLLLLQERLASLTYDDLAQAVQRHITPHTLTKVLELSVQQGTVKRRLATQLEDQVLLCVDKHGAWKDA